MFGPLGSNKLWRVGRIRMIQKTNGKTYNFLAVNKQLYEQSFPSVRLSVHLSVHLSHRFHYVHVILSKNFQE